MSLSDLSSSTSFIVRVMSKVTNSVTCGAVKAEPTIAAAVAFRTPLMGTRVSRAPGATEASTAGAAAGAATGAGAWTGAGAGSRRPGRAPGRRPRGRPRG